MGRNYPLNTSDGGLNWTQQTSDIEKTLFSATFFNAATGWAVGSGGTILNTSDGGLNWTQQTSDIEKTLFSVTFFNATTGWAVGSGGTILNTRDGGRSWTMPEYHRYPAPWYWLLCIAILGLTISAFRQSDTSPDKSETVADLLASDRPLRPDDPDPLRFHEISAGLSRFIRNPRTEPPLTIAVTGEWGTGKSSLMNLLHQDLKTKGFSTVWFNAWHHQKGEQLLASIFANIRSQGIPGLLQFSGGRPVGFLYRLRLLKRRGARHWLSLIILVLLFSASLAWLIKDLDNIKDIESAVQSLLTAYRPQLLIALGGTLAPVLALFKTIQGFALSPLKLIASGSGEDRKTTQVDPGARFHFAREFDDVTASLDLGRMILFIDDLDRCSKENVLEILEAINFLAVSGSCYIVIGMAREWVEICVGLGFKELASESLKNTRNNESNAYEHRREFARHYLEKMINIEVPVPKLNASLSKKLVLPIEQKILLPSRFDRFLDSLKPLAAYWPAALLLGLAIGGANLGWQWGEIPLSLFQAKTEKLEHELSVWPVSDPSLIQSANDSMQVLINRNPPKNQNEPESTTAKPADDQKPKQPLANQKSIPSNQTPALEWVLRGNKTAHEEGLVVQSFGKNGARGELLLRVAKENNPLEYSNSGKDAKDKISKSVPALTKTTSKPTGFNPGDRNHALWPNWVPYGLALPIALVLLFVLFRRPQRIVEDSSTFKDALDIWHPLLMLRPQTPRTIKRFLNRIRYLAMRYRSDEESKSLWQSLRQRIRVWTNKTAPPDPPVQDIDEISEAQLVALSLIHKLESTWLTDASKFEQVNLGEFEGLIAKDFAEQTNKLSMGKLVKLLNQTVTDHKTQFVTDEIASEQQRVRFLNILTETNHSST